ncbi:MAG: hypothetical protein ACO35Q_05390, partial [Prochlorothrix sp.]
MNYPSRTARPPLAQGDTPQGHASGSSTGHSGPTSTTTLAGFLQCLDVRLDDELHRYRRRKRHQQGRNQTPRSGTTQVAPLEILGLKRSQAAGLTVSASQPRSTSPSMLVGGSTADSSFAPSFRSDLGQGGLGLSPLRMGAGQGVQPFTAASGAASGATATPPTAPSADSAQTNHSTPQATPQLPQHLNQHAQQPSAPPASAPASTPIPALGHYRSGPPPPTPPPPP